jgi:NAD(P)H-flavin reductase
MVRFALGRGERRFRFHVLQGAAYADELAYAAELEAAARRAPDIVTFGPTVSRPVDERNRGWRGAVGRVNAIAEARVARLGLVPADTTVYACGHPGMVEDVVARLGARGFAVKEERYWPG